MAAIVARTRARSLALQVLYEVDLADHLPGVVYQERLEEINPDEQQASLSPELAEFARQMNAYSARPMATVAGLD